MCQWIFEAVFLPVCMFSQWFTEKFGLKMAIYVAITFQFLGLWLRCLIDNSNYFLIVGQAMIAIAYPFLLNLPSKISAIWFKKNERVFATSIAIYSQTFGIILGAYLQESTLMKNENIIDPTFNVNDIDYHDTCDMDDPKFFYINIFKLSVRKIEHIMIGMSMIQSLLFLTIVFLWPNMYFNKYGEYSTEKNEVSYFNSDAK